MTAPLRERILGAATRLFAQQGYARTSMREVAEAVGCTKPALYYHFGSKEDLFVAAVQKHLNDYTEHFQAMLAAGGTLRERMRSAFEGYIHQIQTQPEVMQLLMLLDQHSEEGVPEIDLRSVHEEHHHLMSQLLAEGVARGEIRADLSPRDVSISFVGLVHIWGKFCLRSPCMVQALPADLPDRVMDIFFNGVAPHER